MVTIHVSDDCGNAPRKEFIRDFEIAFTQTDPARILDSIADDIHWKIVGDKDIIGKSAVAMMLHDMLDSSIAELTIETIITHGNTASANGTMTFTDGNQFAFCDVFTFTGHDTLTKIKTLKSYVIAQKSE